MVVISYEHPDGEIETYRGAYFACIGQIRGCCGHKHRTIASAEKCLVRDWAGCRRQGGYSDRQISLIDSNNREVFVIPDTIYVC